MAIRKFIAIIEIDDEGLDGVKWEGDKNDVTCWVDVVMTPFGANYEVTSTVYDSITDLVADNALDALAENG